MSCHEKRPWSKVQSESMWVLKETTLSFLSHCSLLWGDGGQPRDLFNWKSNFSRVAWYLDQDKIKQNLSWSKFCFCAYVRQLEQHSLLQKPLWKRPLWSLNDIRVTVICGTFTARFYCMNSLWKVNRSLKLSLPSSPERWIFAMLRDRLMKRLCD